MKKRSNIRLFGLLLVAGIGFADHAQGQAPPAPGKKTVTAQNPPIAVESRSAAPQVVTILHRLNGLKMFRLLLRSDQQMLAVSQLDEAFKIMGDVHTNVIAGLALNDGQTIVAWLPEAEAELAPPLIPVGPAAPLSPTPLTAFPALQPPAISGAPVFPTPGDFFQPPDLTVIARDGKRFLARYVGLDGVTGLSVLKLADRNFLPMVEAKADGIIVGQRLRLLGPEPEVDSTSGDSISVRVGEIEGTITKVTQAPSGGLLKVKIRSTQLSPTNIGGIAVNDAGETIGIVDTIEKGEANILSTIQIQNATRRVLERQSSVPRPWLGVSGQPIAALPQGYLLNNGWRQPQASALTQERCGILLTAVSPGSPAAGAALRPGDVILRVNGEDIRSGDDFSWFLEKVGPGGSASFTVMRPGQTSTEAVKLKLSGALDSVLSPEVFHVNSPRVKQGLLQQGIETIAMKPAVASRFFGANGGLLIVYVQPGTGAFKAGLRPGDIIEAINGQQVTTDPATFANTSGEIVTFEVARRKQKLTIIVRK